MAACTRADFKNKKRWCTLHLEAERAAEFAGESAAAYEALLPWKYASAGCSKKPRRRLWTVTPNMSASTVRCPVSSEIPTCITANGAVLSCHGYSSSTRDSRYLSARFFVSVTFSAVAIARPAA